jgi:type IV secretory pathway VirB6-like protein
MNTLKTILSLTVIALLSACTTSQLTTAEQDASTDISVLSDIAAAVGPIIAKHNPQSLSLGLTALKSAQTLLKGNVPSESDINTELTASGVKTQLTDAQYAAFVQGVQAAVTDAKVLYGPKATSVVSDSIVKAQQNIVAVGTPNP